MALALPTVDGTRADALRLVAEEACAAAGCAAAGVTVVDGDEVIVVGASPLGRRLVQEQWAAGEGPGLDAMRHLQPFNVAFLATATSWPAFASFVVAQGVRSSLALPITLRGRALGALDLYSFEVEGFKGAEPMGLHFAAEAARVLTVDHGSAAAAAPGPDVPGRSRRSGAPS